ncbi:MAG TPA: methyltransferase domain-containing protein [Parachlamydiaceae bacterium]|nr:methyltransferase domain-containing protein [Parachlamydiaceae bacterium]
MQSKVKEIVDYYNSCETDYRTFWDLDRSMAMHAGFWDHQTTTLHDALARENEVLAEFAEIQPHERVLDAGCGIGGSSLFLAKRYGCQVTGITLSEHQVETAKANASKHGVEALVNFEVMDFCQTTFPDASFDVVWGLESICHAEDKLLFVKEAYRLLKKGGRLIMADGFGAKHSYTPKEGHGMHQWLKGWGVESLETKQAFRNHFMSTGFSEVTYRNVTANVMPSSKRLYWISFPASVVSKLGEWLGVRSKVQTQNIRAAYYQYTTLKNGLWEYGIFCAHKK